MFRHTDKRLKFRQKIYRVRVSNNIVVLVKIRFILCDPTFSFGSVIITMSARGA